VLIFTLLNYSGYPQCCSWRKLLYELLRPWLSREWQREIEEEIGEEPSEPSEQTRWLRTGRSDEHKVAHSHTR
jgi:hypothetical protein